MRDPLLAQIHIAKKDLAMDEGSYRAALVLATQQVDNSTGEITKPGKESSGTMTQIERQRVIDHFKTLGWKAQKKKPAHNGRRYTKGTSKFMIVLWGKLYKADKVTNKTQSAFEAWLDGETGKRNPDWLEKDEASKTIEQLKQWLNR